MEQRNGIIRRIRAGVLAGFLSAVMAAVAVPPTNTDTIKPGGTTEYSGTLAASEQGTLGIQVFNIQVPAGKQAKVYLGWTVQRIACYGGYLRVYVNGSFAPSAQTWDLNPGVFTSDTTISMSSIATDPMEYTVINYVYGKPVVGRLYYQNYHFAATYKMRVVYEDRKSDLVARAATESETVVPEDEPVKLDLTIANIGSLAAGETVATLYVDGNPLGSSPIEALEAGQSTVKTAMLTSLPVGEHELTVVADAGNSEDESNEANNSASVSIRVYERVPYYVRFDPNGGTGAMPDQTFTSGTAQRLAQNGFVRTGYTFVGWSTNPTGEVVYVDASLQKSLSFIRNDLVVLYAVWQADKHTVKFHGNGGAVYANGAGTGVDGVELVLAGDEPLSDKVVARLADYDFTGWWTAPTGGVEVTTNDVVKADTALYAQFAPKVYTIRFKPNGGEGDMDDFVYSEPVVRLPPCKFTREGYYFIGWAVDFDGATVSFSDCVAVNGRFNATLKAMWEKKIPVYFHANGGYGTMESIEVENAYDIPSVPCAFDYPGAVFIGWEVDIANNSKYVTYTATWGEELALSGDHGDIRFVNDSYNWYRVRWSVGQDGDSLVTGSHTFRPLVDSGSEGRLFGVVGGKGVLTYESEVHYWDYSGSGSNYGQLDMTRMDHDQRVELTQPLRTAIYNGYNNIISDFWTSSGSGRTVFPGYFVQTEYDLPEDALTTNIALSASTAWKVVSCPDWIEVEKDPHDLHKAIVTVSANETMDAREGVIDVTDFAITIRQAAGLDPQTVHFVAPGGTTTTNAIRYAAGRPFGTLPSAEPPFGYTFASWRTKPDGGRAVDETTIVSDETTLFARWDRIDCTVTFDANGGALDSGNKSRSLPYGTAIGELPTARRADAVFAGWTTERDGGALIGPDSLVSGSVSLYAYWILPASSVLAGDVSIEDTYSVTYKAGKNGSGEQQTATKTKDVALILKGAVYARTGYTQTGWATSDGGVKVYDLGASYAANASITLYPVWTAKSQLGLEEEPVLFDDVDGAAPTAAASEYNGYLYDEKSGAMKGTIQVKVGKPGKKDGKATIKATVVIGTKKVTLKGADKGKTVLSANGPTELELVGGEECEIALGAEWLSGYYGAYTIDGARNFFTSKDKSELAAANGILARWQGSFMVIWDGGTLSVSIAAKGKVKVSGTLANGTKVTANTVLLVGEEWSCVSVAAQKANLAFVLWLSHDGQTIEAEGLGGDVHVGLPGTLASDATFQIDAKEFAAVFGQTMLPYFPNGVAVTQKGTKWTLPKAGKVAYKNGAVDETKLGENPCGLKLTYKAKDGTFKGSFKVYTEVKGKPKATTVNVTGFMLKGTGYGTATVKGKGSVEVMIQ